MRIGKRVLAAAFIGLLASGAAFAAERAGGAWVERVQVVYQPDTRSVVRTKVKVWDYQPEKNLDFVWEPEAAGTIAADGTLGGRGKLVWRVRGSASYDPQTIYSTYVGAMRDGRPNGQGRLALRSGEVFEGAFVDGKLDGKGVHIDIAGNRYDGDFVAGVPNGHGRLAATSGEIFTGSFLDGLKNGRGETRLAGGTTYSSEWTRGKESGRPAVLADPTVGGLLKAQAGSGDADRVEISVAVEARMTKDTENNDGVVYKHTVLDDQIVISVADPDLRDLWNGDTEITPYSTSLFYDRDWEKAPAFVEVDVDTTDGKPAKLSKLELQVANSEGYRKPMLSLIDHVGCVGFRPDFSIKNDGWGEARDMQLNLKFTGQDEGGPTSRVFSKPIGSFDQGIDVSIKDILDEAGVGTAKLASQRYSCPSDDQLQQCIKTMSDDVGFGEIADFVWGDDMINTTATGTLDYNWADDAGTLHQASEPFRVAISLTAIEPLNPAEYGAAFGGSPEALRFQEISFPIGRKDYVVDMPVKGNKNITHYPAKLKLLSEPLMSSFHTFTVAAKFADGSVKKSKPVTFYFMKPRLSTFEPGMQPAKASCYLDDGMPDDEEGDGEDGTENP